MNSNHSPDFSGAAMSQPSMQSDLSTLGSVGQWDDDVNQVTARICRGVLRIAYGEGSHECVPLQGPGTFALEAALSTLVPRQGHVLVPSHGVGCQRMAKICRVLGRQVTSLSYVEGQQVRAADVARALAADLSITHVAMVHCETGAGVLNPLHDVAQVVAQQGRGLIVDATSSFGAIGIYARRTPFDAVVVTSGLCLGGVPGLGFVIVKRSALEASAGDSHSLVLDLHDQWAHMTKTQQWRFGPPTFAVAAMDHALQRYFSDGGLPARGARYARNCQTLVQGLAALGLKPFLSPVMQAPIFVTFHAPNHPKYIFKAFDQAVQRRGYAVYPGKVSSCQTFRVSCHDHWGQAGVTGAIAAIVDALIELGIHPLTPKCDKRNCATGSCLVNPTPVPWLENQSSLSTSQYLS